jgi:hypothetical protein
MDVDVAGIGVQHVPTGPRLDPHRCAAAGCRSAQDGPDLGHEYVQRPAGPRRRVVPEPVEDGIGGHETARLHGEHGQQQPFLRAGRAEPATSGQNLDRPE